MNIFSTITCRSTETCMCISAETYFYYIYIFYYEFLFHYHFHITLFYYAFVTFTYFAKNPLCVKHVLMEKMYITKSERAASFSWLTVLCWMQPKGSSSQDGNTGIYSSADSQRTTYRGGFLKKKNFRCKTEGCLWSTLCTTFSGCCTSKPHDQLTEKPQVSKRAQQDECKEAEADTSLTPTASEHDKNTETAQQLSFHTNKISVKLKKKQNTGLFYSFYWWYKITEDVKNCFKTIRISKETNHSSFQWCTKTH